MTTFVKKHTILSYFLLTFLITWGLWAPSLMGYLKSPIIGLIGAFGPMISALIIIAIRDGRKEVLPWLRNIFKFRIPFTEYFISLFIPILIGLFGFALYYIFASPNEISIPSRLWEYPIFLIIVMLVGGGQEEPGWRGFALPELMKKYSPLVSSIIIGVIWGLWHIPPFITEGTVQYGLPFGWYFINTIAISIILTKIYLRNRSVIPVMLIHAGLNALGNYAPEEIAIVYPYVAIPTILLALCISPSLTKIFYKSRTN